MPKKPEGWKKFVASVKANFPGDTNAGLRLKIYRLAEKGNGIKSLTGSIALTGFGRASLFECDEVLAQWDGRAARWTYEARRALS